MRVEIISGDSTHALESNINDWLGRHKSVNIHDIKYQTGVGTWYTHNAMIIYSYEV
ncbi:sporulation protein Cse60 [Lactobacillus taiwanensis]|uniref:sporulation protein Cse60 n=1 Tax=Lactobacillus taiwanensis TaxID=508451 RepID=UPI00338DB343